MLRPIGRSRRALVNWKHKLPSFLRNWLATGWRHKAEGHANKTEAHTAKAKAFLLAAQMIDPSEDEK